MSINFDKYLYSTGTHYISNSGKDANNGTKGGKAGVRCKWLIKPYGIIQ